MGDQNLLFWHVKPLVLFAFPGAGGNVLEKIISFAKENINQIGILNLNNV
jgi:hypothetical protein